MPYENKRVLKHIVYEFICDSTQLWSYHLLSSELGIEQEVIADFLEELRFEKQLICLGFGSTYEWFQSPGYLKELLFQYIAQKPYTYNQLNQVIQAKVSEQYMEQCKEHSILWGSFCFSSKWNMLYDDALFALAKQKAVMIEPKQEMLVILHHEYQCS